MIVRRVSVGDIASNRRHIADERVGDHACRIGEQRVALLHERRVLQVGLAGHGTDAKPIAVFFDVGQVFELG